MQLQPGLTWNVKGIISGNKWCHKQAYESQTTPTEKHLHGDKNANGGLYMHHYFFHIHAKELISL